MPRLLSTLLVVALLGGTAAAFAVTQGLKIEPSPILAPRIAKVFSPVCDCSTRVATIQFKLRKPDRVRLEIVGDDHVVRTLVSGKRLRSGKVTYTWNGRDDQGRFVPQGVYRPRVHLADQHRTIDLPNDMRVDTTAPTIALVSVAPRAFSPDGDGRGDRIVVAYRTSEPAHAILIVDGTRVVFTRRQLQRSSLDWNGKVKGRVASREPIASGSRPRTVPATSPTGRSSTWSSATSRSPATGSRPGRARGSACASRRTRPVRWRLGARSGTAKPGLLVLRAPAVPGRYTLTVSVGKHRARAALIVRPRT